MFNEHEIACFLEDQEICEAVAQARKEFMDKEAQFLDISIHDFLSLIMITPSIGIALANNSVSLFEELALNKMARKMSKGGFFLNQDPVTHAMKYLIKDFESWSDRFFAVIKLCMKRLLPMNELLAIKLENEIEDPIKNFSMHLMRVPYGFVRFLSSFFLHEDTDVIKKRDLSDIEYTRIIAISEKLGIAEIPAFQSFLKTFKVK